MPEHAQLKLHDNTVASMYATNKQNKSTPSKDIDALFFRKILNILAHADIT